MTQSNLALAGTDGTVGGPGGTPVNGNVVGGLPGWAPLTYYTQNQQAAYGGQLYARVTAGTSAATWALDSGNWALLGTGSGGTPTAIDGGTWASTASQTYDGGAL